MEDYLWKGLLNHAHGRNIYPMRGKVEPLAGFDLIARREMVANSEKPWWERAASGLVIGGACVLMGAITLFMGLTGGWV